MTPEQQTWIDNASYEDLLRKVRFDPSGSEWFVTDVGEYFLKTMAEHKKEVGPGAAVAASKRIGW